MVSRRCHTSSVWFGNCHRAHFAVFVQPTSWKSRHTCRPSRKTTTTFASARAASAPKTDPRKIGRPVRSWLFASSAEPSFTFPSPSKALHRTSTVSFLYIKYHTIDRSWEQTHKISNWAWGVQVTSPTFTFNFNVFCKKFFLFFVFFARGKYFKEKSDKSSLSRAIVFGRMSRDAAPLNVFSARKKMIKKD